MGGETMVVTMMVIQGETVAVMVAVTPQVVQARMTNHGWLPPLERTRREHSEPQQSRSR